MYIDFTDLLNEKMGIISRVSQTTDVFHISELSNKTIEEIYKNVNNTCTISGWILDHVITLKYMHIDNPNKNAVTDTNTDRIYIYQRSNNINKLDIKYLIIHELIHIVQHIRSYDHSTSLFTYSRI